MNRKFIYGPGLPGYGTKGIDGSSGLLGLAVYFSAYDGNSDTLTIKGKIIANKELLPNDDPLPGYPVRIYQNGDIFIDKNARIFQIDLDEPNLYKDTGIFLNTSGFFTEGPLQGSAPGFQRYSNSFETEKFLIDVVYTNSVGDYTQYPISIYDNPATYFATVSYIGSDVLPNLNGWYPFNVWTIGSPTPDNAIALSRESAANNWHFGNRNAGVVGNANLFLDFQEVFLDEITGETIKAGNGTAASPSYTFASNTNTGIYRPASNAIGISTGGTERVRVTPTGTVGIGTSAPAAGSILDVRGNIYMPTTTANRRIEVGQGATGNVFAQLFLKGDPVHADWSATFTRNNTGENADTIIGHKGTGKLQIWCPHNGDLWIRTPRVGVSVQNPTQAIDVSGGVKAFSFINNFGTAALPSYTFHTDTDTGFWRSNVDEIGIATGGVNRIIVKNDRLEVNNATPVFSNINTINSASVYTRNFTGMNIGEFAPALYTRSNIVAGYTSHIILGSYRKEASKWAEFFIGLTNTGDTSANVFYNLNNSGRLNFEDPATPAKGIIIHSDDGVFDTPSLAFKNEVGSGFWRGAAGRINVSTQATHRFSFDVSTFHAAGNIIAFQNSLPSDLRLKRNIKDLENPLDTVLELRGVSYERISTGNKQIGYIAQEVEKIIPEVIIEYNEVFDEEKMGQVYKSINYSELIPYLSESIKELHKQINELKSIVKEQGELIKSLKK
jgi:hypothetical protein